MLKLGIYAQFVLLIIACLVYAFMSQSHSTMLCNKQMLCTRLYKHTSRSCKFYGYLMQWKAIAMYKLELCN